VSKYLWAYELWPVQGMRDLGLSHGSWMLTPHVIGVSFIYYYFVGIHWVTHGRNFIPMPYPYILRVWIPITHGYKMSSSLAHAHCFRVGYPWVPIPMGKIAIPRWKECVSVLQRSTSAVSAAWFTGGGRRLNYNTNGRSPSLRMYGSYRTS
jgi:hypothetical protein